ncbi:MAG: cytidine deaminase [Candidatus Bipolaricaulia bacterium]
MSDEELLNEAIEARKVAYAPYSKFSVGAALLTADGKVYRGVNVENAVNDLSLCAERVALVKAISEGERQFTKIAVVCDSDRCRPCGSCRQVLFEFAPEIEVIMGNPDGSYEKLPLRELLPKPFELK